MIIILPNSKGGLPALLKRINLYNVKSLLYLMDKRTVKVTLPKFKFDFQKRLAPILQKVKQIVYCLAAHLINFFVVWNAPDVPEHC